MIIRKNTAGFTLVEIMIVVAIIGLLAAIAVPNFATARTNSRRSACINNLRLIDAAQEQWALENNKNTGDAVGAADVLPFLRNTINMPVCPSGSAAYTLTVVGTAPVCPNVPATHLI